MNFGGTIRLNRVGVCVVIGICIIFIFYVNSNTTENTKHLQPHSRTDTVNLRQLLIAAISVAEKGGKEVISSKGNLQTKIKGKTKEGADDPVTNADIRSHCVMYYSLKRTFPKLKVISEEKDTSEEKCLDKLNIDLENNPDDTEQKSLPDDLVSIDDLTVWIDPLDATKEYTDDLLQYVSTMVCVAVSGQPVIGVIHKPFVEEPRTWWMWVGKAQSKNLSPLSTNVENDDKLKIIMSISHQGDAENVVKAAFGEDVKIISAAGAGYKSLEVASGNATAYVHTTAIKKWDICAGNAILNGLQGKMTTLKNEALEYSFKPNNSVNEDGLLATMRNHDEYLSMLNKVTKI